MRKICSKASVIISCPAGNKAFLHFAYQVYNILCLTDCANELCSSTDLCCSCVRLNTGTVQSVFKHRYLQKAHKLAKQNLLSVVSWYLSLSRECFAVIGVPLVGLWVITMTFENLWYVCAWHDYAIVIMYVHKPLASLFGKRCTTGGIHAIM